MTRWVDRSLLRVWFVVLAFVLAPLDQVSGLIASSPALAETPVDYQKQVRPLLARRCFACHGADPEHREAELRLDRREDALKPLPTGVAAIVPGDVDASELIFRITDSDDTIRMPPPGEGPTLSAEEVNVLTRWIEQEAPYAEHWSFVPPQDRPLPVVENATWPRDGLDHWILARLEAEGLKPEAEADPHALLRRVSLDLRGLPPTPEELRQFLDDKAPGAYERAVDRFLEDPAFGERWARMWLDLARYADSAGYGSDPLRPDIWRYRDWVIEAFNRNLPYDQFTIEQLAGDLLPEPTPDQKVATAFNRNTMTNTEGGTDDEEFRVAAIKDRVNTTVQVWMGLTMGCAQCHTHKYDPITNEEYYRFFAVFNQTADSDKPDEQPTLAAPTADLLAADRAVDDQIKKLRAQLQESTPALVEAQKQWEGSLAMSGSWSDLEVVSLSAEQGTVLESSANGTIRASGPTPANEIYHVIARAPLTGATALKLQAIPDPDLPAGGAGLAPDGNFVLSRVTVGALRETAGANLPVGRVVRVELPGKAQMLSLAEVEVYSGGQNVATRGQATQSSTDYEGPPELAIDGKTDGHFFNARSTTHTRAEENPWWQVRLPEAMPLDRIVIWNRTDGSTGARLSRFKVSLLDDNEKVVWETDVVEPPSPSHELTLGGPRAVALARVSTDFSQEGFDPSAMIAATADPAKGWAVAPKQAEAHEAVFTFKEPVTVEGPARWSISLEHAYKDAGYSLGRFKLSASNDPAAPLRTEVPADILAIVDTPAADRSPDQETKLAQHYRTIAPSLKSLHDEIAKLEKGRPAIPEVPVMAELPADKRRESRLLNKGNFLDPGAVVEPGLPAYFSNLPEDARPDRLAAARWLVDPANPLTARVAVNRFWSQLFGVGLVETEEDFGTQGDLPSHPEALDWLALRFVESGWDVKALLKQVVTSATYRQSSRATPEKLAADPRNRLYSHAPRYRLEAETVRDQALALAGLLSRKVGGPSVFPPQPDGLWQAAFNGQRTWATSEGNDRYRRGLYTFWRRTVPYPSMAAFDAPSREICSIRRIRTNTPLQAFVTLNDPVYIEASQALARRIVAEGGSATEDRLRFALELCLCRPADEAQLAVLAQLYDDSLQHFRQHPDEARALATEPLGPLANGQDAAEMAAWTTVANILLNLDGVLTRG